MLTRAEQVIFLRDHLFEFPLKHYRPLGDPDPPPAGDHHASSAGSRTRTWAPTSTWPSPRGCSPRAARRRGATPRRAARGAGAHLRPVPDADGPPGPDRLRRPDRGGPAPLPDAPARAAPATRSATSYILVDEFQDTNYAQFELVKLLARPAPQRGGGRRRRPGHLPLPRRVDEQHPRLRPRLSGRAAGGAAGEPPLAAGGARRRVPADPAQQPGPARGGAEDRQAPDLHRRRSGEAGPSTWPSTRSRPSPTRWRR